jgi:hypothetical protein
MFAVAASVLLSALGPASPVRADPPPDPAARLDFVIKTIKIRDDRDLFGSGEMHFSAVLCAESSPGSCGRGPLVQLDYDFSASTGDTLTVDREVPRDGDVVSGGATTVAGVPVYPGQHYLFLANMFDNDVAVNGDNMGSIVAHVDEEHGWGVGTFTVRSLHIDEGTPGDYDLTFEIRPTPLPDLRINGVRQFESDGGQFYCAAMENIGERPSQLVTLAVRADGALLRAPTLPALAMNQITEHCVLRSELPAQQHQLSFAVDEPRQMFETSKVNNRYEMTIPARAPTGAGTGAAPPAPPEPVVAQAEPGGEKAELTVRAIHVNGQAPDGKDDCKVGKNALTVIVKNSGRGDAPSFSVRLSVDGNDIAATVDGLDAGREREVRFESVQLKAGVHTLTAAADAEDAVAESNEDNNELKVTTRCQG